MKRFIFFWCKWKVNRETNPDNFLGLFGWSKFGSPDSEKHPGLLQILAQKHSSPCILIFYIINPPEKRENLFSAKRTERYGLLAYLVLNKTFQRSMLISNVMCQDENNINNTYNNNVFKTWFIYLLKF